MIRIGQMARLCGITPRTLRHYDAIGLFSPAHVDAQSAYRLYRAEQLDELARILQLRHLEVPLDVIGDLRRAGILHDAGRFATFLRQRHGQLTEEINRRTRLLDEITQLITDIEKGLAMEPEITVVELPGFEVAGLQIACQNASGIPELWSRLRRMLADRGRMGQDWIGYGLCEAVEDNGNFTYTAAIGLPADAPTPEGLQRFAIPARRYARFVHSGRIDTLAETFRTVWRRLESEHRLNPGEGAELERYDARFQDGQDQHSEVEGFIPVLAG